MSAVAVRLWAGIAEAAGQRHGTELDYTADTLDDLLATMLDEYGPPFGRLLPVCSVLVDGAIWTPQAGAGSVALPEGALLDVLPPFAGG